MTEAADIYPSDWLKLGIVTREEVEQDVRALVSSGDPYPEHYRWRAFMRFMAARPILTPDLSKALFSLGIRDPDHAMGGSMMAEVLRRDNCPMSLIEAALSSDRHHLVRIARQRLFPDA